MTQADSASANANQTWVCLQQGGAGPEKKQS